MNNSFQSTSPSAYVPPTLRTDGRLGYLTPDQTEKLKQLWICIYDIFDGKATFDQAAPTSFKGQVREEDAPEAPSSGPLGWFGRSFRNNGPTGPRFNGQDLYKSFWAFMTQDHPDTVLLKVPPLLPSTHTHTHLYPFACSSGNDPDTSPLPQ